MRIGTGYDLHRLVQGRRLVLGGVLIDFPSGLFGHSDADVLCHAISDALLGAAALGDIGILFPDSDPSFSGADSLALLGRVAAVLRQSGYVVVNIDSTVIAQQPKLSPYRQQMRENIASACGIPVDAVSVKATTEEFLGPTGQGRAIAAQAVALIEKA